MLLALQYSVSVFREASAAVCRVRSCTGCVTREPGGAEVPRGDAAKPGSSLSYTQRSESIDELNMSTTTELWQLCP